MHLCFDGIDDPGATEQLLRSVLENLKEQDVYWDVVAIQIFDDALCAVIHLRCDDDDLMALVDFIVGQCVPEANREIIL